MNQRDLVFLDLETSSVDSHAGEILEFAAVRFKADFSLEIGSVNRRCRMDRPAWAQPEALAVCGYNEAQWASAEPVRVSLVEYAALLGGERECVVVAQNPIFDTGFIDETARRESFVMPRPAYVVDLASIAWPLVVRGIVERINLETLCVRYGVPNVGAHRAMNDVRRTVAVYRKLVGL